MIGVFLGSAIWWLVLSSLVALLRSKFNPRMVNAVNKLSGTVLTSFGALVLISVKT